MPWSTPTLPELRAFVRDRVRGSADAATLLLPKSVTRVLSDAVAGLAHMHFRFQAWLAKQIIPSTAESAYLQRWLELCFPVPRIAAAAASGTIIITGASGASVATGARLSVVGASGQEVMVTTGGTIGGGGSLDLAAAQAEGL